MFHILCLRSFSSGLRLPGHSELFRSLLKVGSLPHPLISCAFRRASSSLFRLSSFSALVSAFLRATVDFLEAMWNWEWGGEIIRRWLSLMSSENIIHIFGCLARGSWSLHLPPPELQNSCGAVFTQPLTTTWVDRRGLSNTGRTKSTVFSIF